RIGREGRVWHGNGELAPAAARGKIAGNRVQVVSQFRSGCAGSEQQGGQSGNQDWKNVPARRGAEMARKQDPEGAKTPHAKIQSLQVMARLRSGSPNFR